MPEWYLWFSFPWNRIRRKNLFNGCIEYLRDDKGERSEIVITSGNCYTDLSLWSYLEEAHKLFGSLMADENLIGWLCYKTFR
jgi:hypothetical protein